MASSSGVMGCCLRIRCAARGSASRYLEADETIDDFLEGFPSVTREQVIAFLEEAKDRLVETVALEFFSANVLIIGWQETSSP